MNKRKKLSNIEALIEFEQSYNGEFTRKEIETLGGCRELTDIEYTYNYYDQYNKPCVLKDKNGNIVGKIEW